MSSRDVNVTEGDILKPLALLAAPIVLSQLLQVGYNLADTFWVGQLGQEAVSALSYSWPLVFLMISVAGGFTVAGTVLVAQNKGAGNDDRVDFVAGQTIAFVGILALAFAALGYLLTPWLVGLIGATPGSIEYTLAVEYTQTVFLGVVFMFGFFIFQALLRGWGDTKTPLALMILGVALNVVLDPFLILGFEAGPLSMLGLSELETTLYEATGFTGYGVQGAAIATVFSRGVGAIIGMAWLFSGRVGISLSLSDLRLDPDTLRDIVAIGAPASIEQSMRALGITALTALVAVAGDDAVAAFGIGNRLNSLVFLPAIGLSQGIETVVGQNLGNGRPDRAKQAVRYAVGMIAAVLAAVTVVAVVFAEPIVSVFISGESAQRVIDIGVSYLRVIGPTFVFLGIYQVCQGAFRGSGSTRTAMIFSILSLWVFRLPIAYVLVTVFSMGAVGIWYGIAASNVLSLVVAGAWYLRGTWATDVLDREPPSTAADN
ncbi:MAG: MATE family efflux transporter [Halobacteriales archaeon]|nr:MATE family efflux transporter [Halobacteriales archaeon]